MPPPAAPAALYEAEGSETVSNLSVASDYAGFTGQGYRSSWGPAETMSGQAVAWTVQAPTTASYVVRLRYTNGGHASVRRLVVNGAAVAPTFTFPPTAPGTWTDWRTVDVAVPLVAGPNTIEVVHDGWPSLNYMLFDSLERR